MPLPLLPLIPAILSGVGGLLSQRKGSQSQQQGTSESTRSGTTTISESLGTEASSLLQAILPMLMNLTKGGSVNSGYADQIAQAQTMGANQQADAINQTLQGNAASRGLTYSAPSSFARGIAESFRGNAIQGIMQQQAQNNIDINRGNRAEQTQGTALAANVMQSLPQNRVISENSTLSGTNSASGTAKSGSGLGDSLRLGGDIFTQIMNMRKPGTFNLPAVTPGAAPTNPAVQPVGTPPFLPAQVASNISLPGMQPPRGNNPYVASSITYDF